jgi:predicted O-methyltransferase YrrM
MNEVSNPTKECPNPQRWQCIDDNTAEIEVLQFLESLVYMLKPETIVETGSHKGYSAYYLAHPRIGAVHTAEVKAELLAETMKRCEGLNVFGHERCGEEMIKSLAGPVDFAFLDSGLNRTRIDELKALKGKLSRGAIVLIHDTNTGCHLAHRSQVFEAAWRLGFSRIQFNTPRGLTMLQELP